MSSSNLWIAAVPAVEGQFGTGPVDLSLATQTLSAPAGFDLPGGAGQILDRAYRWFIDASNSAPDHRQRDDYIVDAARALNNFAVWCLTRWGSPDAGEAALNALQEADRLLDGVSVGGEVRGGVYFNLGKFAAAEGARRESAHYLGLARSYGFNVSGVGDVAGTNADEHVRSGSEPDDDVHLDAEPEVVLRNGKTQLMFWAAVGSKDEVGVLIRRGVDLDAVDDDGDTALLYAVSKGHSDIAELLLGHGADPNICGDSGVPIRLAASRGWTEMVRTLAANGADVDARSAVLGTAGVTAVMFAAGGGYVECLRALLDLGADPELVDSDGDNALFYAQSNGKSETARLLMQRMRERTPAVQTRERGAEVDHEEIRRGYSAIDQAVADQRAFESMSLQTEFLASQGQWGLHAATTREDVASWLRAGAPINGVAKIDYGDDFQHWETPLLTAFIDGQLEAVEALLQYGAEVDAPNAIRFPSGDVLNHTTLLMLAQRGNNSGVARLIEAGADVNRRTNLGTTALHFAAGKDNVALVAMLLQAGADPNVREFDSARIGGLGDLPVDQAGPRTRGLLGLDSKPSQLASSSASAASSKARVEIYGTDDDTFVSNHKVKVYWNGRVIGNLKSIGGRFAFQTDADGELKLKSRFRSRATVRVRAAGTTKVHLAWDRISGELVVTATRDR